MDRYGLTAFLSKFLNEPMWGFPLWKVLVVAAAIAVVLFVAWIILVIGIWCSSMSRSEKVIATALILHTGPLSVIEWLPEVLIRVLTRLFCRRPPERGPRLVRR